MAKKNNTAKPALIFCSDGVRPSIRIRMAVLPLSRAFQEGQADFLASHLSMSVDDGSFVLKSMEKRFRDEIRKAYEQIGKESLEYAIEERGAAVPERAKNLRRLQSYLSTTVASLPAGFLLQLNKALKQFWNEREKRLNEGERPNAWNNRINQTNAGKLVPCLKGFGDIRSEMKKQLKKADTTWQEQVKQSGLLDHSKKVRNPVNSRKCNKDSSLG